MMCYLIYWKAYKSKTLCIISVFLTITSLLLTAFGRLPAVVDTDKWAFTYLNPYLNVFNWIGMFALGILAKNGKLEELVMQFAQSSIKAWTTVFISILGWMVLSKIDLNTEYWSWGGTSGAVDVNWRIRYCMQSEMEKVCRRSIQGRQNHIANLFIPYANTGADFEIKGKFGQRWICFSKTDDNNSNLRYNICMYRPNNLSYIA